MADPNNDRESNTSPRREQEDAFARSTRHFDNYAASLFGTLWSLPATIYQRGNEHGREFSRLIEERQQQHMQRREHESRGEREEEQEREDGRGRTACGWRGRRAWHHGRRAEEVVEHEGKSEGEVNEDWLKRVAEEVERNQQEARRLYEEYEKKVLAEDEYEQDRRIEQVVQEMIETAGLAGTQGHAAAAGSSRSRSEGHDTTWTDLFPAWSTAQAANPHEHQGKTKDMVAQHQQHRPGPLVSTAQQIEDALHAAHSDITALMAGTSHIARAMRESYDRESRMWDHEGLFGSHPLSRPLSTVFSLGMRPFMPTDSAIGYLLFNEYSPLHLEEEAGFDASFRKRFEDLVRLQAGKDMTSKSGEANGNTKVEWLAKMSALLEEGEARDDYWSASMERMEKELEATAGSEELGPHTEEEVHNYFHKFNEFMDTELEADAEAEEKARNAPREASALVPARTSAIPTAPAGASDILSTLTTTTRHVAADGTVVTKTVLKKRFADGREETESEETTQEADPGLARLRQWQQERLAEKEREAQQQGSKIVKEAKKGSGWFWSS